MIKRNVSRVLFWDKSDTTEILTASLQDYYVSITKTDTVLGFLALFDQQGFTSLNQLKGGRSEKPYLILVGSAQKISVFTDQEFSDCIMQFIMKCWPGPVTFIFRARKELLSCAVSPEGTVALRCPDHKGLQELLYHFDGLFSTSANRSGKPVPSSVDELDQELLDEVAYLIVDTVQHIKVKTSTILDLTDVENNIIKVVREGAFSVKELEHFYGKKFNQ